MSLLRLFVHDAEQPLLFNSGTFFLCFTLFVAGYILLFRRSSLRVLYVLLFSAFYYYKCNGVFALALLFTVVADYAIARLIAAATAARTRLLLTALSITLSLSILGYFKYASFALDTFAWLSGRPSQSLSIFLPIGISFYTFQSISYVVDVYRGRYEPRESLIDYAFYLSFFPQIVAGPIVRAADLFPQIRACPRITPQDMRAGLFLIVRGLVKKAIIADYLGIYSDLVYATPSGYAGPEVLLAIYAYSFQIYFDFSGYSDMAVGMARVLGVSLPDNFRAPYRATHITAFWQRWHITLSSWLRDYLYIPLGGSRCAPWRRNLNLMITMLLGGLWHGAAWTFVAWGGLHGGALALHKWWRDRNEPPRRGYRDVLAAIATFHFVALCWVLFRAPSFAVAGEVIAQLAGGWQLNTLGSVIEARAAELSVVGLAALLCMLPERLTEMVRNGFVGAPLWLRAAALLTIIQSIIQLRFTNIQPFIYFQF